MCIAQYEEDYDQVAHVPIQLAAQVLTLDGQLQGPWPGQPFTCNGHDILQRQILSLLLEEM